MPVKTSKIKQRFLLTGLFAGLVFIFLFNIGQAKANFSTCGITPTLPLWQAKAQDGTVVMTVDSAGNLDIVATTVQTNTAPPASGLTNSFIIKNSAANKFVFNKTNAYITGSILENQAFLPATNGDDLVVKNSAGIAVALFDATTGNIYLKAKSCGACVPSCAGKPCGTSDGCSGTCAVGSGCTNVTLIKNCTDLQNMKNNLSASYELAPANGSYIDCSETATWNWDGTKYLGFEPVGTQAAPFIMGKLDGKEFKILNLYINRSLQNYVGLFGYSNRAEFKNIRLENVNVVGYNAVGGLVAMSYYGDISNSYATGAVVGYNAVGGLVGYNYGTISNSYATGAITGGSYYNGGLLGIHYSSLISNSYWNIQTSGKTSGCGYGDCTGATGLTNAQMTQQTNYVGLIFSNNPSGWWEFASLETPPNHFACLGWQDKATCPVAGAITNCTELQNMKDDLSGTYVLANNIDCSETATWNWDATQGRYLGFKPIGDYRELSAPFTNLDSFTGKFDGKGFKIYGLYINKQTTIRAGLFGDVSYAEIKNVGLENVNITGNFMIGGLVGWNYFGTISNSSVSGIVNGSTDQGSVNKIAGDYLGGLVGYNYKGVISDSFSTATINGKIYINGGNHNGGLVGYNIGGIYNSYATGVVNRGTGQLYSNSLAADHDGGLVGSNGFSGTGGNGIYNSYATGAVNGYFSTGGLVGANGSYGSIFNSYATGYVNDGSGYGYIGGLIGQNSGSITSSYWDINASGQALGCAPFSTCGGVTGKTTAEMTQQVTYSGWVFPDPWTITENSTYPCHKWYKDAGGACPVPPPLATCSGNTVCGTQCNHAGLIYGTVIAADGKCWLDRNLGASRQAISLDDSDSYGWLFQWGRLADGHQIRTSNTTTVKSSTDIPGHSNFYLGPNSVSSTNTADWRSPANNNLWQGVSGINNPCPTGFRLPTEMEWIAVISAAGITNAQTAYNSSLKIPSSGYRAANIYYNGAVYSGPTMLWSSTPKSSSSVAGGLISDQFAAGPLINSGSITPSYSYYRCAGESVRCIKN